MKKILIAAMLVTAPAFAAENTAAPKAEDAIKAAFARLDTCIEKNDSTCLGELFADDATFAGPMDAKLLRGKAEIIKTIGGMMNDPSMKGVKPKRSVHNVRLIGRDWALVDCSVDAAGNAMADAPRQQWRSTALMALKGGKWLVEDIRSYGVYEPARPPTPRQPNVPAAPTQPAQPNVPPAGAAPTQPVQPNVPPAERAAPTQPAQPNVPEQPAAPPKT